MTVSRVQFKHVYPGTSGAFTSNVTAGNLIVVYVQGANGTDTDSTCSDSLGNTYAKIIQKEINESNHVNCAVWYAYNISGGACTVTCSAGTGDKGFTAVEYTSSNGAFSTDPLDDFAMGDYVSGTVSPLTQTVDLSTTGFLFATWGNEVPGGNNQTGWTSNLTQIQKDTGHYDAQAEGLNLAAGTYVEGSVHSSNSLHNEIVSLIAFKDVSAPSTNDGDMYIVGESVM